MKYYPVFLKIKNRKCVVIGGGDVAERKVQSLVDSGAAVTVISPTLTAVLQELAGQGAIEVLQRNYEKGDLKGAFVAIAATDDVETNRQVFHEADEAGSLVNVVDDPENCNFIVPAVARRGDLMIAISTCGRSPALARWIRQEMEDEFLPDYEELLTLLSEIRTKLDQDGKRLPAAVWQQRVVPELLPLIRQGNYVAARNRLLAISEAAALEKY